MSYTPVDERQPSSAASGGIPFVAPQPKQSVQKTGYTPVAQREGYVEKPLKEEKTATTRSYIPVAERSTNPLQPPAKQPFSAVDEKGNSIGFSDEKDTSGKPLLAYRNPGDTATTTDKTRVATSFDPRVAAPTSKDQFLTPRAVADRASLKTAMGGGYSDELDHKIALELSGSNEKENLQVQPGLKGGDASESDVLENSLARDVASGKKSLFDAQVELANQKGIKVPWTPAETKQPGFFEKIKNFFVGSNKNEYGNSKGTFTPPNDSKQESIGEHNPTNIPAPDDLIKLYGTGELPKIDNPQKLSAITMVNAATASIDSFAKNAVNFINSLDPRQHYSASDITKKAVSTGISAAMLHPEVLLFTSVASGSEDIPGFIGKIGKLTNATFGKIGELGAVGWDKTGKHIVDSLPFDQATKNNLNSIGDEISSFASQMLSLALVHGTMKDASSRVKELQDAAAEKKANNLTLTPSEKLADNLSLAREKMKSVLAEATKNLKAIPNRQGGFIKNPLSPADDIEESASTEKKNSAPVGEGSAIPPDLQPLAQEAKKYKSADEFVNNAEGFATRYGEVDKNGAYFSTKGSSTYFDPLTEHALDHSKRNGYDISSAKLVEANTPDGAKLLQEALKDSENTPQDIVRLKRDAEDGFFDYHIVDEIPAVVRAAKKLGYDGIKLFEADDVGHPSSVFIWNTKKAISIGDPTDFYNKATKESPTPQEKLEAVKKEVPEVKPASELSKRERMKLESDQPALKPPKEKVPLTSPFDQKIEQLTTQHEIAKEAANNNPAKKLEKYVSRTTGELPEVTGKATMKSLTGSGKTVKTGQFGKQGDTIAQEVFGSETEMTPAEVQRKFDEYKSQVARAKTIEKSVTEIKAARREFTRIEKDKMSLTKLLDKTAGKTEKDIADLAKPKKPAEIARILKERQVQAQDRIQKLIAATYNTTPPLERETMQSVADIIKEGYDLTLDEFEKSNAGDPFNKIAIDASTKLKNKVGLHDYLRTPDRVLEKIGLGHLNGDIRHAYESYLLELPLHIDVIKEWAKRVPSEEGNRAIFRYLDGQMNRDSHSGKVFTALSPVEMKVAREIKAYLAEWADRLGLPEDSRISHYITHIFGIGEAEKEFDEDVAKIIQENVAGSVYDPFLEKRLGKKGYIENTWKALDAYVKRATRKANMDPVLEKLDNAAQRLEISQYNYVKRYTDRINLRPTEIDNILDNTLKQFFGYRFGQRPTAYLSSLARRMVYRYALGGNVGSALKNLTQGVNTYAVLGEKYTTIGYTKLITMMKNKDGVFELESVGILNQDIVQDKTQSAASKFWEKADKGLFFMFETAEMINRGAAYYGAKAKGIAEGMDEMKAIEYAKKVVRDTQFNFGSIDTPVALGSDLVKLAAQFTTFGIKQSEFLGEKIKIGDIDGLMRYTLASIVLLIAVGKAFNISGKDFIPGYSLSKFGLAPSLALPKEIISALFDSPDAFGNPRTPLQKGKDILAAAPIPASIQVQKTYKGITSVEDPSKKLMKTPYNYVKGALLGQQNLDKDTHIPDLYNQLQDLKKAGKQDEADKIYKTLPMPDKTAYNKYKTSQKRKVTIGRKPAIQAIFDSNQELKRAGKTDEANAIYNKLSPADKKIYQSIKKSTLQK